MLGKIITEEKKLDGPSVEPYQFTNEVSLVSVQIKIIRTTSNFL